MRYIKNNFFDIHYYDELSDSDLKNIIMEHEMSYKFFEVFSIEK